MVRCDLWIRIEKAFSDSEHIDSGKQDKDEADAEDDPQWQH
jgi:hypothetical protein